MKDQLKQFLNSIPVSKWGIADISEIQPYGRLYARAISLLFDYRPESAEYDEQEFHELLQVSRERKIKVVKDFCDFLNKNNINHYVGSFGTKEDFKSDFSHKYAATKAGLGWIGKNTLLVSDDYGPRVRLATIFIDLDIPSDNPMEEERCGDCQICVDVCPVKCIKNVNWFPGLDRDEMLDAAACKKYLRKFENEIGCESDCGLCLLMCPVKK